jgi:putative acyl-CoA dehydrogenase
MARIYRDIEINTVWEGSGNVMALDVLRAVRREPEAVEAFLAECGLAAGADARLDHHLARTRDALADLAGRHPHWNARRVVEELAVALQGSLLVRHSPPEVADAFCAGRLGDGRRAYGTLPDGVEAESIVERALAL